MGLVARRTGRMLARGLSARLHEALLRIGDALTPGRREGGGRTGNNGLD